MRDLEYSYEVWVDEHYKENEHLHHELGKYQSRIEKDE